MGFCTQCGSSLESGTKFCTNCGAWISAQTGQADLTSSSIAAAAQPELEPTAMPVAVAAPESFDVAEPNTSSRPLIIAIAIVLIVTTGAGYWLFSHPKPSRPAPIIDGRQASAASVQTYGLEQYPGARPVAFYGGSGENVIASFETNDTPEQVIGYYRVRFPVAQLNSTEEGLALSADMNGRPVQVQADALVHGSRVKISISQ